MRAFLAWLSQTALDNLAARAIAAMAEITKKPCFRIRALSGFRFIKNPSYVLDAERLKTSGTNIEGIYKPRFFVNVM